MNSETWRIAARCLGITVVLSMSACQPGTLPTLPSFGQQPASSAQPSAAPATLIPLASPSATASPTAVPTDTLTFTPIPSMTATSGTETAVGTAAATGSVTPAPTGSATLPSTQSGATATLVEPIVIDTLPPSTVYVRVRIENESNSQMDISLHCTTKQGLHTILEYNNVRNVVIDAPEGDYVYVVYVGGRKIVGGFSLFHMNNAVITVYSDHVAFH
ncbi:MAG: hypothetical protein ACM3MF_10370 [Anaerolineae bacterium]